MRARVLILFIVGMGAAGVYSQDKDRAVESKIIALERVERLQAFEAKDLKTLDKILDDTFVLVDQKGELMTKANVLAYIRKVNSLRYQLGEMDVRLHGDTVVVTGLYQMNGIEDGKPFLRRGRFVDTWMYRNERWVAMASVSVPAE